MADPNVRIIVTATDKASGVLRDVAGETGKLGDANKGVIGSYTELSSMLGLANQGLQMAKDIYRETVGVAMEYAQQVDDVARATGMSTEESSRWIQIADDVRIGYDQLKTAMRIAITQGIDPSIEGMKQLSAQYLAIQDPIARSDFLIKTFGRSGLEMGRLLERGSEGIDELNQGINKGLILTPQAIQAAEDYRMSLDNMNDTIEAVKITIGNKLIPTLDAYITMATTLVNINNLSADSFETLGEKIFNANPYARVMAETMMEINKMSEDGASNTDMLSYAFEQLGKTIVTAVLPGVYDANVTFDEFTGSIKNVESATWGSSAALEYQLTIQGNAIQTAQEHAQRIEEVAAAENAMKAATDSLDESLQKFGERLGTDIASKLEAALGDTEQYEAALTAIDETLGTALGPADAMEDAVEDLTTQFANGEIDLDTFKARLTEIKNEFAPFDEAVKKSMQALTELGIKYQDVLDLPDRIDLWVYTHWVDVGNPPSGTGGGAGNGGGNGGGQEPQLQRGGIGNVSLSLTFNGMQGGVTQTTIDQIGQSIREALTSGIAHAGSY